MFAQEKTDPRVRFHVGQGIILSIYSFGLSIVTGIISFVLSMFLTTQRYGWGIYYTTTSPIATIISSVLWLAVWGSTVFLAVMAIININKNQDKPLPIIGKFAFYK